MAPTKNAQTEYNKLFDLSRQARILEGISAHLGWDSETYLPDGAHGIRAEQRELLAKQIHKQRTAPTYHKQLQKVAAAKQGLNPRQRAALREWERDYQHATCLPNSFVSQFSKLTSQAAIVWREARAQNNFSAFAPWLQKIVDACRKKADFIGYKNHPYDALLDLYEPYLTSAEVTELFGSIKPSIEKLVHDIGKAKQVEDRIFSGKFSEVNQLALSNEVLNAVGYDRSRGRLDLSAHPFSNAAHPSDSRITTHVHTDDLLSCLLAVLHEFGHALYELNLPQEDYGSPLCDTISHGIHESQSRFWETRIGLSKPFWTYALPLLQKHFPKVFDRVTPLQLYRAANKVKPSLIRIEADEVTYTLHIILRYELELQLIEGSLKIKDLPEAWNAKMKASLGVTPKSNAEGCLQDIHWSMGSFGYFPSYSLGNIYAAHFFPTFAKQHPHWEEAVAKGDFAFISDWLRDNIHCYGRQYSGKELLKKITGTAVSPQAYIAYLNGKYRDIYAIG